MSSMRAVFTKPAISSPGLILICLLARIPSADAERSTMIDCLIRVTAQDDAMRIDAVARGRAPADGQYRLEIAKDSASGSSRNVQSGAFHIETGRDSILTTVVLDGSARSHYHARLVLDSDIGSVTCVSP